ncbi:MAG: peptide chain release factor N(5)-glutamine methyltransferase [Oceanospirillaceae bacterium]|nr:peptide chain release factor N(5)-glutamine methyltransferase [Oceanospirillaceae bacterium]
MSDYSIAFALQKSQLLAGLSDTSVLDVRLLLAEVLGKSTSYLFTWPEKCLTQLEWRRFNALLERRVAGEPIAYLLGYQDFWSLRLAVSKDTLIPRPDTELLVEQALSLLVDGDFRVADLGTGTGAVALSLATERPGWKIVATDLNEAAAQLAEKNRQSLNIRNVQVLTGAWFEPLVGKFDLIVSNPPYIDPLDHHLQEGDVRFEPLSALIADDAGMSDIEALVRGAGDYLQLGGWLLLEHGYQQGAAVRALFERCGYREVQTVRDLAGNDRVSLAKWSNTA